MKRVGSINNLKRDASSTTSSNEVSTTTSHTINTITHKNINESIKNDIINKNNNNLTAHQQQQQQQQLTATNQNNNNFNHQFALSQWITQTFVATAIKIKQSPLPEIVTMTTDLSLETYKKLDSLIGN